MDALRELVGDLVAPAVARDGYVLQPILPNQSFVFHRRSDTAIQVVDVQRSRAWTRASGAFTVNLGVHWPEVVRLLDRPPPPPSFETGYCPVSMRLGTLVSGQDHWWSIEPATEVEELGREIVALWVERGKTWLDLTMRLEGSDPYPWFCYLALGRREEARTRLLRALETFADQPDLVARWTRIGEEQGLL